MAPLLTTHPVALQAGIPFEIYERDEHSGSRSQGWAITLHWALAFLRHMLDPDALAAVDACQVDPEVGRKDTGNFIFINAATLEAKFRIPPNDRRRVGRQRFRLSLLDDPRIASRVHWGKRFAGFETTPDGGPVTARFDDGTVVEGAIVVGAEGTNSRTRQCLVPHAYLNRPLDIKLLGVALDMTPDQARPLRAIDPLLFQGCHPDTGCFLWISTLETPAINGSEGTGKEYYKMQLIISWPVRTPADADVPATRAGRAAEVKRRAAGFHPTLAAAVDLVTEEHDSQEIILQDWPCLPWDNRGGAVTLVGDAAHAMTMFRGEAANHGIMDAYLLSRALRDVYEGRRSRKDALDDYEAELRERTSVAVEWSREACLGAHDFHGLNEKSAVLRRRAIKMPTD